MRENVWDLLANTRRFLEVCEFYNFYFPAAKSNRSISVKKQILYTRLVLRAHLLGWNLSPFLNNFEALFRLAFGLILYFDHYKNASYDLVLQWKRWELLVTGCVTSKTKSRKVETLKSLWKRVLLSQKWPRSLREKSVTGGFQAVTYINSNKQYKMNKIWNVSKTRNESDLKCYQSWDVHSSNCCISIQNWRFIQTAE